MREKKHRELRKGVVKVEKRGGGVMGRVKKGKGPHKDVGVAKG